MSSRVMGLVLVAAFIGVLTGSAGTIIVSAGLLRDYASTTAADHMAVLAGSHMSGGMMGGGMMGGGMMGGAHMGGSMMDDETHRAHHAVPSPTPS